MLYYLYDITKRTEMQPCFGSRMRRVECRGCRCAFPIGGSRCVGSGFHRVPFRLLPGERVNIKKAKKY
ncbi:hypothetical protein HMPREF3293_02654 [Christensenella minuta]|uniref:Uncharacterized protein n=1 Tax=Christensenella minuta TaxID=626937 RepID=A0A136Q1V5_9FIRM|nr:hypothetical protein HMPREF3293_02654 [Christensenella minuta]